MYSSFFFQADDGIRDTSVTGVQTCALPICCTMRSPAKMTAFVGLFRHRATNAVIFAGDRIVQPLRRNEARFTRSEERRVGKEGATWWWALSSAKSETGMMTKTRRL